MSCLMTISFHFCKENNISEVVTAGDIMSYHLEEYDILHQRSLFNEARIAGYFDTWESLL